MQAFKLFFKIFKKSAFLPALIYVLIFIGLTYVFSSSNKISVESSFETSKLDIAIINNDNSAFSDELVNYLNKNSSVQSIDTDEDGIKDALFFRTVEYILIIPEGYGNAFLNGDKKDLETRIIPNSVGAKFMDQIVSKYLKTFKLYLVGSNDMSFDEIVKNVNSDLSIDTLVTIKNASSNNQKSIAPYFFSFTAYPLISAITIIVSMVMVVVNGKELKRRNLCSPVKSTKFNLFFYLANILMSLIIWALFVVFSINLFNGKIIVSQWILYCTNMLIFTLVCLTMSFLIGNIANKDTIQPIATVISLGGCFLGGAFVEQSLLSEGLRKYGGINPVYWYVKANDTINSLTVFDTTTLKPVFFCYLIEAGFILAFLAIALVVMKQNQTSNN